MLNRGAGMITLRQVKAYLEAKPFRPFRLFLPDGSRHGVPHPEFAWVFGSRVFVGVAGNGASQPDSYVKETLAAARDPDRESLPAKVQVISRAH